MRLFKNQGYLTILILTLLVLVFDNYAAAAEEEGIEVQKVICNVIEFVRKLGLPVMTLIIIGSSIMAMFGRLQWPTIMILVVFTAVFFGADKLVNVFTKSLSNANDFSWNCSNKTPSAGS